MSTTAQNQSRNSQGLGVGAPDLTVNLRSGSGSSGAAAAAAADTDATQPSYGILQEKLAILRAKLNEPDLTKESVIMVTSDLQPLYKKLLLTDLNRGIQKQLENFLWNDCFKKPLTIMSKVDSGLFHLMIDSGIGFYLGLIREIGDYFGMQLDGQNNNRTLYCTTPKTKPPAKQPAREVAYYVIQNSIIHLGDLLRYRSSFHDAQRMYDKATKIGPTNGHPWNQMGLIQLLISGSLESILIGVYCYARALCVSSPFLPAQQNLEGLLSRSEDLKPGSAAEELIQSFLRQVLSITSGSPSPTRFTLEPAEAQVAPIQNLTRDHLFLMIIISLWVWRQEADKTQLGMGSANTGKALELVAAVMNGMLTEKSGSGDEEKFELVAYLNIMLQWLRLNPSVLARESFKEQLDTKAICTIANQITTLPSSYLASDEEMSNVVLPEERRLLGFIPVSRAYEHFKAILEKVDPRCNAVRATRFLRLMNYFATPECGLIELDENVFKPIQKPPSSILRPAPRQNVALQSLLKNLQKPTSSRTQPPASQRVPEKKPSVSVTSKSVRENWDKPITPARPPTPPKSSWPEPKPREVTGRKDPSPVVESGSPLPTPTTSFGGPPPGFEQRPHSGMSTPQGQSRGAAVGPGPGTWSEDTSPIPSGTQTPLEADFSLLFNSIWTPTGNEGGDAKDKGPSPW